MTWLQTASGRAYDLVAPQPELVDFVTDVPDALARTARFNGHVASGPYSVAQHCVIGADYLYNKTGSVRLAGGFLLHDAHEYVVGDIATPVADALTEIAREFGGPLGAALMRQVIGALKFRQDVAIFKAAGMEFLHDAERAEIKRIDLAMLATERRHLMATPPKPWAAAVEAAEPLRLKGGIKPMPWPDAAAAYRQRLIKYLPLMSRRAA